MSIRIVAVPSGEAPEEVRRAWVGLVLPLAFGEFGPRSIPVYGVLTGPQSYLAHLWRVVAFRSTNKLQYLVPVDAALEVLEETAPEAAAWWRKHTPHMVGCNGCFGFDAEACELA
jgi:hypothetical protein